jgi:hypothetical protein
VQHGPQRVALPLVRPAIVAALQPPDVGIHLHVAGTSQQRIDAVGEFLRDIG